MIPPQKEDCILELDFEGKDEGEHLHRETPPINIIPQKEVLGGLERAAGIVVDDFDEVVELAVNIADDCHRILDLDHICFLFYVMRGIRKTALARLRSST